jgi:hypothetical protein
MIFAACVVPIGKLFEKNTAGRQVGSGQGSTAECLLLGEQRKTFARFEFFRHAFKCAVLGQPHRRLCNTAVHDMNPEHKQTWDDDALRPCGERFGYFEYAV